MDGKKIQLIPTPYSKPCMRKTCQMALVRERIMREKQQMSVPAPITTCGAKETGQSWLLGERKMQIEHFGSKHIDPPADE